MSESNMPGARVRHLRRKFVESILKGLTKEEILDLHEHWSYDTTKGGNGLFWEFSRYVAVVSPEHFRDTPRRPQKGDSVVVKKVDCNCSTCSQIVTPGVVLQVYSTEKEEKALRDFNTSPQTHLNGKGPIIRLAKPDGGSFSCCTSESSVELVGTSCVSNVRVTPIRQPEPCWGIDTPEETEALVTLNVMAKSVGAHGAIARSSPATVALDEAQARIDQKIAVVEQSISSSLADAPSAELLLHKIAKERIDSLTADVEWLQARVSFLIAWVVLASVIAFGGMLALWNAGQ